MEFSSFSLHPDLQRGIAGAGYLTCMPVQEQVLANAFSGHDLYVQSQTGTGKTAAFLVVIFQRLLSEPLLGGKKALIMVPTRELAVQVEEEAKVLGKYLPFKTGSFFGGVGYNQQFRLLKDNVQILVGTPGRVLDLNSSGNMNLMDTAFLVLDEADRMFDMGFYPDLRKLIKVVPPADRRQTMLFSATLNSWVKNLAWEYTKNPFEIEIEPETVTVDEVEQLLYHVHSDDKMRLLLGLLKTEQPESALIFCNTKRYTEIVAKRLRINGIDCEFIIGDLPQIKRLKIIEDLKAGAVRTLVATDVAARGLDVEGLALVVNYDLPVESENYVHRIGRTARAGKTGKAISLVSEQDVYELPAIERYIGKKIPSLTASEDSFTEDKSAGLKIRTDFYDDRGSSGRYDSHDGGPSRSGGRGYDGSGGRESGRGGSSRSGGSSRTGRDRSDGGRSRSGGSGRSGEPRRSSGYVRFESGSGRPGGSSRSEQTREEPETGRSRESGKRNAGFDRTDGGGRSRRQGGSRQRNQAPAAASDFSAQKQAVSQLDEASFARLSLEERMAYYKEKYGKAEAPVPAARQGERKRPEREQNRRRPEKKPSTQPAEQASPPDREGGVEKEPAPKKGLFSRLRGLFGKKDGSV